MTTNDDGKIECKVDGARVHAVQRHLETNHPGYGGIERYKREFPGEPVLSDRAREAVERVKKEKKNEKARSLMGDLRPMHEVFDLGKVPPPASLNSRGDPIMVAVSDDLSEDDAIHVPEVDTNYVFDIENVKSVLIGRHMNVPIYIWGYHGTGKTTILEQMAARMKRPLTRVQHTVNTEESHIYGQWTVKEGNMVFNYGPLPLAMLNGWDYCADEYDRAPPTVVSVYQPVMEGKALYIKEAPPEMRLVKPHPNFRFVATGNTNGSGDETGLYQGAVIQDAANYSRFGLTIQMDYMEESIEVMVVAGQANVAKKDAAKLVSFAKNIREAFKAGRMGSTISPRELINAAKNAAIRGGAWREGIAGAWGNRLSRTDREVADQFAQRVFG